MKSFDDANICRQVAVVYIGNSIVPGYLTLPKDKNYRNYFTNLILYCCVKGYFWINIYANLLQITVEKPFNLICYVIMPEWLKEL